MDRLQIARLKRVLRKRIFQKLATISCLLPFRFPSAFPDSNFHRMYALSDSDSWDTYRLTLFQPVLTYKNYQATCLLSTGSVTYDSSFTNELTTNSFAAFASAGG